MSIENPFDLRLPVDMAKLAEQVGIYKATKNPATTFYLAMTAGVFISIAFVFYITATTGTAGVAFGLAKLVGGLCFSLGLILVIICGADLFTSTVLIVVAKASGKISWRQLIYNWINVYFGNLIGALFFCRPDLVCRSAHGSQWFMGPQCVANCRPQITPYFY